MPQSVSYTVHKWHIFIKYGQVAASLKVGGGIEWRPGENPLTGALSKTRHPRGNEGQLRTLAGVARVWFVPHPRGPSVHNWAICTSHHRLIGRPFLTRPPIVFLWSDKKSLRHHLPFPLWIGCAPPSGYSLCFSMCILLYNTPNHLSLLY